MNPSRRRHGVALFGALGLLYAVVGSVLVLRYNIFEPDAPNRVANAGFALQSRHPHLSAIGFVWNPLPSLVELPLVWLSQWPGLSVLKHAGLAGVVQSAAFMSGAALMVRRIAFDVGVPALWRRVATAGFALHPMIVIYGASGLSEAAQMFCLLWCVRYLMRWCTSRWVGDLGCAGMALGVGYLARYEVIPAAAAAVVLVAVLTWRRSTRGGRWSATAIDVVIIAFPVVTAFFAWAITGWIINDEFFATMSSQYGNASQVAGRLARGTADAGAQWPVVASRLFGMQPLTGVAVAVAVVVAATQRRAAPLVPVVVFGGTLTFAAVAQHDSLTFGWFRFYLLAIPLVICVALACWEKQTAVKAVAAALVSASVVVAIPVTTPLIVDQDVAYGQLEAGFASLVDPEAHPPGEDPARRRLLSERRLAQWFDSRQLPEGSVLMDTFLTWGVWLSSEHPKQFVITSDYDFVAALNRPWDFGIRYIVATNPKRNVPDALNRRYPSLWDDGAGIAALGYTTDGPTSDEMFRVYRTTGRPVPPDQLAVMSTGSLTVANRPR
ncbi:hypothetical protein FK535_12100 [Mycolicibacterium sp. 018/SC-01/001]|uniref:hypothetical protein n=1 Tax=Mycolicibacterium sp. 018/SC-01/001 TaxID=2592069 RepID=UPI00117D5E37|nr:hypothetical protein [Mycolicibacterium sp. 018/SC-01/001]TRW82873.1 hypothetical protein FK535_12100 [Mycolicibacterium sp. 018/SC-01/001]